MINSSDATWAVSAKSGRLRWYLVGIAVLGATTLYFATVQDSFYLYVFNRVLLACVGAVALNLLMGTAGQLSMGNAAFLLLGAMSTVYFVHVGLPFPVDVIFTGIFCGLVGAIVSIPALKLKSFFLALATLALHFIVLFAANQYQAHDPVATYGGFTVKILFSSSGLLGVQRRWAYLLFVVLAVTAFIAMRLTSERTGRAWRMLRDHELVAPSFGISVKKYKLAAFVLSSSIIGLEGGLLAHFTGNVDTGAFTLILAIQYIAMILIGGQDRVVGAIIGAAIVTALPVFVPRWLNSILGSGHAASQGPQIAQIIYGLLIILFITSSPDGVAGWGHALRAKAKRLRSRYATS